MGDNEHVEDENEANERSSASNPPSGKPKAKQASSSESSLSSDSLSAPSRKKTRQLPNLSDCHSCGLRINYTDPKDRLQTLDSVWRIVLLCKKCIKLAHSAQICTYCFSQTSQLACFNCPHCRRCIHKDCALKYRGFAPWSYSNSDSDFSVCLDCWVPKLLRKSDKVYRRRNNNTNAPNPNPKLIENGVKLIENGVGKKIKEHALRKAVVAKSAVEVVACVGSSSSVDAIGSNDAIGSKVVDDVELAFQLHRAINSSPRILRNSCLMYSSGFDVPKIRDSGAMQDASACVKIEVPATDTTISLNGKECQENGVIVFHDVNAEECNSGDDSRMKSESVSFEKQDMSSHELGSNENSTQGLVKPDRYLLKYSKRPISSKAVSNSENKFLCDSFLFEKKASESRLPLKCYRRSKLRYDSLRLEKKPLASGLPLKCYKRSRKFSRDPFQSCAVHIQPFSCTDGSSREHPQVNRFFSEFFALSK